MHFARAPSKIVSSYGTDTCTHSTRPPVDRMLALLADALECPRLALSVKIDANAKRPQHRDVDQKPLCCSPFVVVMQNCLRNVSLAFTLHREAEYAARSASNSSVGWMPHGASFVLGHTRRVESWLRPLESFCLPLSLAFTPDAVSTFKDLTVRVCAVRVEGISHVHRLREPIICDVDVAPITAARVDTLMRRTEG